MLYNKTWDKPTKTPEELMDLSNILNWLESKHGTYNFFSSSNCLLAQYYKDYGYKDVNVSARYVFPEGVDLYYPSQAIEIPDEVHGTIRGFRSFFIFRESFKGALKRGRRIFAQNSTNAAYAL